MELSVAKKGKTLNFFFVFVFSRWQQCFEFTAAVVFVICKVATIFAQINIAKLANIQHFSSGPFLHLMPFTSFDCFPC